MKTRERLKERSQQTTTALKQAALYEQILTARMIKGIPAGLKPEKRENHIKAVIIPNARERARQFLHELLTVDPETGERRPSAFCGPVRKPHPALQKLATVKIN